MATTDFELTFLLLTVFLVLIKGAHVLMKKLDLPNVLGEVVLGFIVGPSILGIFYLSSTPSSIFTGFLSIGAYQVSLANSVLLFLAEFAVLLLLFKVGTETDFNVLKSVSKSAFSSAIGGIIVPLLVGIGFFVAAAFFVPDLILLDGVERINVLLFLVVALTATSIGISTRIFLDLGKIKTKVAQTVIGAAVIDDIISVTALALTVSYVTGALQFTVDGIGKIFAEIGIFFAISFLLFKYVIPFIIQKTKNIHDRSFTIFFSIGFMLFMAVLAQYLQLAPIIGAFIAGVIIGNEDEFLDIHGDYEALSDWIIPFFFISIGLQINVTTILTPSVAILGITLAVLAILAKFTGGTLGSKIAGYSWSHSKVVGLSMAAKGEVTLIFATTAYTLGFFTPALYFAVILLVVIDSLVVPTLLKIGANRWLVEDHESNEPLEYQKNVSINIPGLKNEIVPINNESGD